MSELNFESTLNSHPEVTVTAPKNARVTGSESGKSTSFDSTLSNEIPFGAGLPSSLVIETVAEPSSGTSDTSPVG